MARRESTCRCLLLLAPLLAGLLAGPLAAQPTAIPEASVRVVASVDRNEVTIGDPIRYTVEISAPSDAKVLVPVYSGVLGTLTITDFGDVPTRQENGRTTITRWYTLSGFETGEHTIPAPKVGFALGDQQHEAVGNELKITIASLLAKEPDTSDIRNLKPVQEPPFDWRPVWLGAAALAVLLSVAGLFYFLLNRPKRGYVLPPSPPHEVALAALSKLRTRHLIEDGQFEPFYVELSRIARRYLEDRFHVRAPEMTTEEFLTAAGRDQRLSAQQRRLLGDFLAQADLVKFAKHLPTLHDTQAAFEAAKRFVEDTRPSTTGQSKEERRAAA